MNPASRLIVYDREVHLEVVGVSPVTGDTVEVFRGNGPREGEWMGTATVDEVDEDGSPILSVHLDGGSWHLSV